MLNADKRLPVSQIADAAECSCQTVYSIRSNLQLLDNARLPQIRAGQQHVIMSVMLNALCDCLLKKTGLIYG